MSLYFTRKWRMLLFRKEYIKTQIAKRKGRCKMCGKCCYISLFGRITKCPFLNVDGGNRCRIWKILHWFYPFLSCHLHPIEEDDLFEGCGYHW